jgi:hypothetical protein
VPQQLDGVHVRDVPGAVRWHRLQRLRDAHVRRNVS